MTKMSNCLHSKRQDHTHVGVDKTGAAQSKNVVPTHQGKAAHNDKQRHNRSFTRDDHEKEDAKKQRISPFKALGSEHIARHRGEG